MANWRDTILKNFKPRKRRRNSSIPWWIGKSFAPRRQKATSSWPAR